MERCSGPEWDAVYDIAVQLPIVELHLHLDGRRVRRVPTRSPPPPRYHLEQCNARASLSEKFIASRAAARGVECPQEGFIRNWLLTLRTDEMRFNPERAVRYLAVFCSLQKTVCENKSERGDLERSGGGGRQLAGLQLVQPVFADAGGAGGSNIGPGPACSRHGALPPLAHPALGGGLRMHQHAAALPRRM